MGHNKISSQKNIAIIGGGFTGLTAAYKLLRTGHKISIFEAGSQLGGLVSGCSILGSPIEKSPHVVLKNDQYLFKLLKELKIKRNLNFYKSSIAILYENKLYPFMNPVDLLNFSPLKFYNRIRAGLVVLYLQKIKNSKKLASITAMKWLNKYAGEQVTKIIWEPLLKGKFAQYFDKVTMEFLQYRIKSRLDCADKKKNSEILGYLNGGWEVLVNSIVKNLAKYNFLEIKLNTYVNKIEYDKKLNQSKLTIGDKACYFDSVLLTVPSNIAAKIIKNNDDGGGYFFNLEKIKYLDAVVMLFATTQPISKYFWHNINMDNSPFVTLQTLTNLIGNDKFKNKHVHYIVTYVPADHYYSSYNDKDLKDLWIKYLQKFFPKFDSKTIIESKLFRLKNAQHIVDMGYKEKIPDHMTPLKRVYLCNFSQLYPMDRGINYAIRDGYRMAELITGDLKL
jgi:protoporphyrinogen oxidase